MKTLLIFVSALLLLSCTQKESVMLLIDGNIENKDYLTSRLQSSFKANGISFVDDKARISIKFSVDANIPAEGFKLNKKRSRIRISASSAGGFVYASNNLIEQFQDKKSLSKVTSVTEQPRFPFRAIKYNLPYFPYRADKSLVQHAAVCRDIKYWEKYLDMMAENRFNALSLWSLHLFHYMIIPENYPEASHFTEVEMADWKAFWTQLFKMAKERGIETYIVNWNIFVSPSFARANKVAGYNSYPSYFGPADQSPIVEKYTREVIRQVIDEYPDLTGLGITLGERMGDMLPDERRGWLDRTIFAGMRDASREIKFIYRAPLSADKLSGGSTSEENDLATRNQIEALQTNGPVWLEFKYNWSHGHSSPNLFIVHGGKLTDKYINPPSQKYKYVWTVRNEDFFVHRWGQPDFIREFIANNGHEYVGGTFLGSEVFIPALDYTSKEGEHKTWNYSFERLWLWYSMWGRLLYNPDTPDKVFENMLDRKYGNDIGEKALQAWKLAGKVPLHFASFREGRNDLSLYTEGHCGWRRNEDRVRFFDILNFSNHKVLDTMRYMNISDYVTSRGAVPNGIMSPLMLADSLDQIHAQSLSLLSQIRINNINPFVDAELSDIEAWAWYAKYIADKIRGGVALLKYQSTKNAIHKSDAVEHLEKCISHWTEYANITTRYHKDEFLFYTNENYSWHGMLDFVKMDVEIAKNID